MIEKSACRTLAAASAVLLLAPGVASSAVNDKGERSDGLAGMELLSGGAYTMGAATKIWKRISKNAVTVAPFLLDVTEVSVGAYRECVQSGKCSAAHTTVDWPGISRLHQERMSAFCNWGKTDRENHPVNCVDWNQATAYCAWAGKRLPTEEEWEWAARGAERGTTYPWGDEAPGSQLCWDGEGSDLGKGKRKSTCPVGSYPRGDSPDGIKDLAGNVWEWTSSLGDGPTRVLRGGPWHMDLPPLFTASYRLWCDPGSRFSFSGFRCARTP